MDYQEMERPEWDREVYVYPFAKAEEQVEEIERKKPDPVFHYLFKLPREVRDRIWEKVIENDNLSVWGSTCLAVRRTSRALYFEAMEAFSKTEYFYINPDKDQMHFFNNQWTDFTPSLAYQVQNLVLTLTKINAHRFSDPIMSSFHDLMYLEDAYSLLSILARQTGRLRKKCILEVESEDDVFTIPDEHRNLKSGLMCLQRFDEVEFRGRWYWPHGNPDNIVDGVEPEAPFDLFIGELEEMIGPGTRLYDDPSMDKVLYRPLQFMQRRAQNEPAN